MLIVIFVLHFVAKNLTKQLKESFQGSRISIKGKHVYFVCMHRQMYAILVGRGSSSTVKPLNLKS